MIADTDDTPQGFPLQRLLRRTLAVLDAPPAILAVVRANGYGPQVHAWDERLQTEERITVPVEELDRLCAGTVEWFYNIDIEIPGAPVRVGLFDSSFLFVEAPAEVTRAIAAEFSAVTIHQADDP